MQMMRSLARLTALVRLHEVVHFQRFTGNSVPLGVRETAHNCTLRPDRLKQVQLR